MIDVHTHLFNAAYVPIQGIVEVKTPLNPALARIVATICNRLVRLDRWDPHAETDAPVLVDDTVDWDEVDRRAVETPIEADDETALRWAVESASEDDLEALEGELREAEALLGIQGEVSMLSVEIAAGWSGLRRLLYRVLRRVLRLAGGWGRWILLLLGREGVLRRKMYGYYPNATHFVVHMMDMDAFYAGSSKLDFVTEQVPRLAAMAKRSEGRLLPFVAFDPTRPDAVDIVAHAVRSHGFRGVKFYPPSGYRPLNNTAADVPRGTSAEHVEAMVRALYDFCTGEGVPIFTHCQPKGMDARCGSGLLSHPAGWRDVLEEYPELTLCIGHAGGEPAWFGERLSEADAEWRHETVRLCCEYPNVYCEVGHLDDLTDGGAKRRFENRLVEARETGGDFSFEGKVMYGSDYHLIVRTRGFRRIPSTLRTVFGDAGYDVDGFAAGNARRYLSLPSA